LYEQLLLQDSWSISQLGGKRNVANGAATLSFGREGRLSAYAGCNRMAASYVYHAGALEIGPLISTKMACMPETKMRDEQALGAALNQQRLTLVATQNGLALMRGNAKVMELVPLVP
jgi:heat shock protein HslJ